MSPGAHVKTTLAAGPCWGPAAVFLVQNRRGKGRNPETAGWVFLGKKIQKPAGNGAENCGGHVAVC